jgi:hypothetical protein
MQSRLANVVALHRNTDLAHRQLEASSIVLREYLAETFTAGGHRHVTSVLQALHDYLLTDPIGRKARKVMKNDPAAIFAYFQGDERLGERWRKSRWQHAQVHNGPTSRLAYYTHETIVKGISRRVASRR